MSDICQYIVEPYQAKPCSLAFIDKEHKPLRYTMAKGTKTKLLKKIQGRIQDFRNEGVFMQ